MTNTRDRDSRFGAVRGDELFALTDAADWGPWRLYPSTLVLVHIDADGYEGYEVDLEDCLTPGEVCDWIFQIAGKGWADDRTVAGLVRVLDEVLEPQANLCSFGGSKAMPPDMLRDLVRAAARRRPEMVLHR